jgi:DNA mismatch repair protein MutS2
MALTKKLNQLEIENTRLQGLTGLYERENQKLKDQKEKIIKETREKADLFLDDINSQFENTVKRIKESNAEKQIIREEKEKILKLKRIVEETYKQPVPNIIDRDEFNKTDYVQIKDSLTSGEIIEIDNVKGTATIEAGALKIKAKITNLIHIEKPKNKVSQKIFVSSSSLESTKLDIRGRKPEEIEFEVVKFIDDAHLSGLRNVEIIHGKGTGVLRESVHQLLKNHTLVKSFELADIELGGAGATDVKLK